MLALNSLQFIITSYLDDLDSQVDLGKITEVILMDDVIVEYRMELHVQLRNLEVIEDLVLFC